VKPFTKNKMVAKKKASLGEYVGGVAGRALGNLTGTGGKQGAKIGKDIASAAEKGKKVGGRLGSAAGGALGDAAGKLLGKFTGIGGKEGKAIGQKIGGNLGKLLPFKLGGKINKDGPIYAHHGEFILPAGVHPDKHQLKIIKMKGGLAKKKAVTKKQAYKK
jgi:phage tail tape-measure protein